MKFVKLIGNLDMPKTRKAIKAQLKGLNNLTFNITPNVNTKGVQTATKQAINNAQRVANSNKVHLNFDTNKQQLVNQIKILGRNNNKLFNNHEMTAKYNQLLNSANVAKSTGELKTLRGELSAFKTELVATNNAGMTWGGKFKESVKSYTKFFSGASLVYAISNQVRNAATEAKTLDDSLVNLQKVTDEIADRDALYKYFDKSLSKAQELNVKVGSLIDAVTEFKKLGWDLDDAELGAKWANILSNVGDTDIETAIGSIKTSIASFDEIGGYGNDQMDKKLEAYTDLINNMSNKYSIDAEGLAESIRLSAGTLTEAHMSIEQAATMFATANKYYNDPSYLGNTAKIGSLRMRASSGDTDAIEELQEMGEEVDDLATATSNLREKLMALTGVDIMEDEHTFKSYYDQLYEISQVMDKLDDTSRANVLETMFGKSRSAAGAAILSGMKESASAYEDAINSAGSATEEYQAWMTSADAACQRFSNTLTEAYQSIINGNTVRDLANLGSAVLEFANNWGIVEGTLKGVIALNLGKFIATGGMALITATKQVEQYGKALQMASNVPNGNLSARFQALKSIAQATSTLTTEQLRNVLATNTLTQADRVRILQMQGMTKEMALQKLAEMNLTQATNQQTAANNASTLSTFSLKAAMTGLGATLKSVFLSNPVGIALMGISLGVSAVTSAVSKHNQAVEEARQKAKEAADNANTLGDEIAELANKYIQLSDAVKTDASAKEDLMTTQTELLKKLGLEGESIDDLIAKYGSLSNAIKQASIDSLKDQQIDLIAGVDAAREELIKAGKDAFGSDSWKKSIVAMGEEAGKAWQVLEDAGIISSGTHTDVGGEWFLSGDASEQGVLENYKTIEKALEALRDSNKFTQEELSQNDLFKELYDRYNIVKEAAESYDSEIDNLNENLAQQTMLTALQGNELPKTEEDFNKFKQALIDTSVASKQFIGNEKEITDAINNYLSTVPEFEGYYSIPLENELDKVDELLNQEDFSKTWEISEDQSKAIDDFQSKVKTLSSALSTLQSGGELDGGTFTDLMQEFPSLSEESDNLEEAIKSLIEDALKKLYSTLGENLPDNYKNSLREIADEALNTKVSLKDALSDIQKSYDVMYEFKDAMLDNGITDSLLNSVASLSDELNTLVAGFYAGAVSAEQLFSAISEQYNTDLQNYSNALIEKNALNSEFYSNIGLSSTEVINHFRDDYGVDIENCKSYAALKAKIELETLGKIARKWSDYYDLQTQQLTEKAKYLQNQADHLSGNAKMKFYSDTGLGEMLNELEKESSRYQEMMDYINNITYEGIDSSFDKISTKLKKASNSSSGSSSKDSNTEIDWIQRKVDILSDALDELKNKLDGALTSKEKRTILDDEIEKAKELREVYTEGAKKYEDAANSYAKSNSSVLSPKIISKIQGGTSLSKLDIEDFSSENAEIVNNYIKLWDNYKEFEKLQTEIDNDIADYEEQKRQTVIDDFNDKYDLLKHNLEMGYISEKEYYISLRKLNEKYYSDKEKYGDEYKQYEEEIYKGLESYYKSYCDDMMTYYQKSLETNKISFKKYSKNVAKFLKDMFNQGKISAKDYYDYLEQFYQEKKDIYDKVLSAVENRFDKEIDKIDDQIDKINDSNDALEEQKTLYENAASAVVDYYDKLIDNENDLIDSVEEVNDNIQDQIDKYDSLISVADRLYEEEQNRLEDQKDAIQDKIDLINDENDAKDLQYRKEQALYELERSQQQRTKKVYVGDKGFIYDTDKSAISDAKKNVEDIRTEELISSLEKEKDALDDSIDALQKYRDALSEISDAYNKLVDERNAMELIGANYKDIIFGTSVEDWDKLKDKYISAKDEITDNENLIKSYEEKIKVWEKEKEQWSSLTDVISQQEREQAANQLLGANWKQQINNGALNSFDGFKDKYLQIQSKINSNDELIESLNKKKSHYEDLKQQWSDLTSAYEDAVNEQYAASVLGADWESKILSGRLSTLNNFKDEYIRIQQEIANAQVQAAQAQVKTDTTSASASTSSNSNVKKAQDAVEKARFLANKIINKKAASSHKGLIVNAYETGTKNAKKGINLVGETVTETYVDNHGNAALVTQPTLIPMEGGETVYNGEETKKMLSMRGLVPVDSIGGVDINEITKQLGNMPFSMPNFDNRNISKPNVSNVSNTQSIVIGDIHLHGVQNVPDFGKALKEALPGISVQFNGRH